jgi:hypothetical protein
MSAFPHSVDGGVLTIGSTSFGTLSERRKASHAKKNPTLFSSSAQVETFFFFQMKRKMLS